MVALVNGLVVALCRKRLMLKHGQVLREVPRAEVEEALAESLFAPGHWGHAELGSSDRKALLDRRWFEADVPIGALVPVDLWRGLVQWLDDAEKEWGGLHPSPEAIIVGPDWALFGRPSATPGYVILDGWHRVADAARRGRLDIRAIVGETDSGYVGGLLVARGVVSGRYGAGAFDPEWSPAPGERVTLPGELKRLPGPRLHVPTKHQQWRFHRRWLPRFPTRQRNTRFRYLVRDETSSDEEFGDVVFSGPPGPYDEQVIRARLMNGEQLDPALFAGYLDLSWPTALLPSLERLLPASSHQAEAIATVFDDPEDADEFGIEEEWFEHHFAGLEITDEAPTEMLTWAEFMTHVMVPLPDRTTKLSIGEVSLFSYPPTRSLLFDERVAALRMFFRTGQVPDGLVAVAFNPQREVGWNEINWDTAGSRVTG